MAKATCSIGDCARPVIAHGWCTNHYSLWKNHGDPNYMIPRMLPPAERFWAKVKKTETCWLWTGAIEGKGYGSATWQGRYAKAHRVAYEMVKGPIPAGLQLDHLCRVRHCVNPDHLEPVTNRENVLRGDTIPARWAARDRCGRGHLFTPENTLQRSDGGRRCKTCQQNGERRRPPRGRK